MELLCLFLTDTKIKIRDKVVDIFSHDLKFSTDCYKTQKMCDKAVNICPFVFDSVPDQF